jgi:hypothetical protein
VTLVLFALREAAIASRSSGDIGSLMKARIKKRLEAIIACFHAVRVAAEALFQIRDYEGETTALERLCQELINLKGFMGTKRNHFSSSAPYLITSPTPERVRFTGDAIEFPEDLTRRLREYIQLAYPGADDPTVAGTRSQPTRS